jgi:hypothetical protein
MAIVQKSHSSSQRYDTRSAPPAKAAATAASAEKIAARAYEIWQANGCPDGQDLEHWLQAERELRGNGRGTSH